MKQKFRIAVECEGEPRMWWIKTTDGWSWLRDEKKKSQDGSDGPYDEYGEPLGTAFDRKSVLREMAVAKNTADWDGLPDPKVRLFKDTGRGLIEVYRTGKRFGQARDGAKPL